MKWSTATATLTGVITAAAALLKIEPRPAAVIRWHDVLEWFTRRSDLKAGDPDHIAFTLLRRPAPAHHPKPLTRVERRSPARVILLQGLFNTRTETLVDCRAIEADRMDDEVAEAHRGTELVVYK
jgi:hypothetical protein